jgi:hypothetical protein
MATKNKLLSVLSEAEQFAIYGLPDFDDGQRLEYLSLCGAELALASRRPSLSAKVYCALQIGYFKAKHAFFRFTWDEAREDFTFVLTRYFDGQDFEPQAITKHEHYRQRVLIAAQFGYRLWSAEFLQPLTQQITQIVRRDVTPGFVAAELLAFLNGHKIVRPGYTTLQTLVSEALSAERQRLGHWLAGRLDDSARNGLKQLLVRDDTLPGLAALKQDAKHFGYRQMVTGEARHARAGLPAGQGVVARAGDFPPERGPLCRHLRPLFLRIDFASTPPGSPWLAALAWMKGVFVKAQRLSQRPLAECPGGTLPRRLRPYLLEFGDDGKAAGIRADRYEFWIYRQVRKRLRSGEIHLDDSQQYRRLTDELVSLEAKAAALGALDIP